MLQSLHRSILAIVVTVLCASSVVAQEWQYRVTPYIWTPALDLSLDIGPNAPVTDEKSILDILDGAFLLQGEARRGRLSFLGEYNYLNLSDDFGVAPSDPIAEWRLQGAMISVAAGYAVHQSEQTRIDMIGGLRAWNLETSTTVLKRKISKDSFFVDPLIGFRVQTPIGRNATFSGLANIGGSTFGSDRQVEAIAQVKWPWRGSTELALGYRYLSLDFDDDSVLIDTTMRGPFISIGFNF